MDLSFYFPVQSSCNVTKTCIQKSLVLSVIILEMFEKILKKEGGKLCKSKNLNTAISEEWIQKCKDLCKISGAFIGKEFINGNKNSIIPPFDQPMIAALLFAAFPENHLEWKPWNQRNYI
jgi:hypothetical protein